MCNVSKVMRNRCCYPILCEWHLKLYVIFSKLLFNMWLPQNQLTEMCCAICKWEVTAAINISWGGKCFWSSKSFWSISRAPRCKEMFLSYSKSVQVNYFSLFLCFTLIVLLKMIFKAISGLGEKKGLCYISQREFAFCLITLLQWVSILTESNRDYNPNNRSQKKLPLFRKDTKREKKLCIFISI